MKHQSLRRTRARAEQIAKTKSIYEVLRITFNRRKHFSTVDEYFVPFELVKTADLVAMLQRLTIASSFGEQLTMPDPKILDRLLYLKQLREFSGMDLDAILDDSIRLCSNKLFVDNEKDIVTKLRKELNTREHLPNKKDKKIIRQLKAQGKYIID